MGVERVTDLGIFQQTCNAINKNSSMVSEACSNSLSESNQKLEETQEELANSRRLLEEAIAEEQRRLLIKQECEAEVEAAAAGLPETAGWYADACARLAIAIEEYERAVAHRILMERRVALAEQCVQMASEMVETLTSKYNYGQNQINYYGSLGISRLNSADRSTSGYVGESLNVSRANEITSQNKDSKQKNKVYCENLGMEVVCVGAAPGQEEFLAGHPFAGQTGKNAEQILSNLKYKGQPLSRDKVSFNNAWTEPLWKGEHNKTEEKRKSLICGSENISRLNEEIGSNTKIVIAFGDSAYESVTKMKETYGRKFVVVKAPHPGFESINRNKKYTSNKLAPEERNIDRLSQISDEIRFQSEGLFH